MKADWKNTAVIVPIYNSYKYLEELLGRMNKFIALQNIFLIDDGSAQVRKELVPALVHFRQHQHNLGKGMALQTGFKAAAKAGFNFAFTIDSDLQHKPEDMASFLEFQNSNDSDLVIGKRDFKHRKMPWPRKFSNGCTSKLVSWLAQQNIHDSQSGYRLYNLNFVNGEHFVSQRYQFETEILLRFAAKEAKIGFVPIETIYGDEQSHISHLRDIYNFLKILLKEMRRKNEYITYK